MQTLYIFIATFLCCSSLNAQTISKIEVEPYEYDTTLKGGYTISFKADDSLQYLYLKKGDKIITELAATSRGLAYKNLGYIGADFNKYFILVHSYGSGNPNYIELIKKVTGNNILKEGAAWIDVVENKGMILYCDSDVPSVTDKMTLDNVQTGQKQLCKFPIDIFGEPQILNRIQIAIITDKQLVIKYDTKKGTRIKSYSR